MSLTELGNHTRTTPNYPVLAVITNHYMTNNIRVTSTTGDKLCHGISQLSIKPATLNLCRLNIGTALVTIASIEPP